jgi:glycosyltransferase involved in cell wall biosynthesis
MADIIYFVIPCCNEEEVLPMTAQKLSAKLRELVSLGLAAGGSRILFVDDGSSDDTWQLIRAFSQEDSIFTGIRLAHNRGHQNALLAGLMTARQYADAVISMDADLQDDPDAAGSFIKAYYAGCDIVYGVRKSRSRDSVFKRSTARGFYKLMNMMGVELVYDHADYRLMSRKALDALSEYREVNLFLRGIIPEIGLRTGYVYYERARRAAGKSKYPLKKMLAFACDGITSFSVKPLSLIAASGAAVAAVSAAAFIVMLITGANSAALLGSSLWFLGGVQLLATGITGTYIGKIYKEVKARPRYCIEQDLALQNPGMMRRQELTRRIG